MKDYLSKIASSSAKLAFKVAKVAAGNASWWGFFQPKEPEILKKLKNTKL